MPIDRTNKTALDSNLVNGVTSDAPKIKANNDTIYNFVDGLESADSSHANNPTLAHLDGSVTGPKIKDGAVTTAKIADGAVTAPKIANGSLTADKFVDGVLTNETQNGLRITALELDIESSVGVIVDSFTELQSALTAIGSGNGTIVVAKTITVTSNTTIPANVDLFIPKTGLITINSGVTLTINGTIQAGLYQIFSVSGTLNGYPTIIHVYPEWFGALRSLKSSPVDVTAAFNKCFQVARNWGSIPVRMSENRQNTTTAYHVTNLLIPAEITLEGASRERTEIIQIAGSTGPVISDDPATGAMAIRLKNFRVNVNNNNSDGIVLGFNAGYVWGVEGRIEGLYVTNANGYGYKVKSSVSSMEDVIALFCNVGFRFEGGSCSVNTIIGESNDKFIEFAGSSTKIFGAHTEGESTTVIDFLSGSLENKIHHLSILLGTTAPYGDLIHIASNTQKNGITTLDLEGFSTATITNVINDEQTNFKTSAFTTQYQQSDRRNIRVVGDSDLNGFGAFGVNLQTSQCVYIFNGSNTSMSFSLPAASNVGISATFANKTTFPIKINAAGADTFLSGSNNMTLPAGMSVQLTSDGYKWIVSGHIPVSGTTAGRPSSGLYPGYQYYDTTLGKPIWYSGSVWKDSAGTTV